MRVSYYLIALLVSFFTASLGGYFTVLDDWYYSLNQPLWKPDDLVFPIAWTTIFVLCSFSAGLSLNNAPQRTLKINLIFAFLLNAGLNVFWSYLYFFLRRPDLAMLEVIFLWNSILLLIVISKTASIFAAILLIPYLMWVTLASVLNYQTAILNGYL